MPRNLAARIVEKVEAYASAPDSLANNVVALEGSNGLLRLRVGDWRVVFANRESEIIVSAVAPRGGVYGGGGLQ